MSSNHAAILADTKFLTRKGPLNFYSLYRCHDYPFKIYGAMFLGQFKPALEAADEMIATLPEDLLTIQSPPMADCSCTGGWAVPLALPIWRWG